MENPGPAIELYAIQMREGGRWYALNGKYEAHEADDTITRFRETCMTGGGSGTHCRVAANMRFCNREFRMVLI